MNNDLNQLYGNSPNNDDNNLNNNTNTNNQDLNSLYNITNNTLKQEQTDQEQDNNIKVSQEGLSKLYNQNTTSIDDELKEADKQVTNSYKVQSNNISINNNFNNIDMNIPQNPNVSDETLLVAYVGKNVEKIAGKPFNFSAFFFGPFYMLFRKRIFFAFIYLLISIVLQRFMHVFIVGIGLSILSGSIFNTIYIASVKKDIKKIKRKNPTKNSLEIQNVCKKSGGRNFFYIFLIIIIQSILISVMNPILAKIPIDNPNTINKEELEQIIEKFKK